MWRVAVCVGVIFLAVACHKVGSGGITAPYQGLWQVKSAAERSPFIFEVIGQDGIYGFDGVGCLAFSATGDATGAPAVPARNGLPAEKYLLAGGGIKIMTVPRGEVALSLTRSDKRQLAESLHYVTAAKVDGYFSSPISLVKDFCCPVINPKPINDCK
jgi:hypothetical protein